LKHGRATCSKDRILQLQSDVIPVVLTAIPDANIAPKKYEVLKKDVKVAPSFGYPSSPIKEEAEMIHRTTPKPSAIRAKIYRPTLYLLAVRIGSLNFVKEKAYDFEQSLVRTIQSAL
jgi:hypothetical protein